MSFQDPISDCLTRIRNGLMRGKTNVLVPYSKLKHDLVDVLVSEGYLKSCSKTDENKKPMIDVELKYHNESPVIKELKRVSRPGLREYVGKNKVPLIKGGLGMAVISTSKGLMTDKEAREAGLGGEVVCSIF